jgi:Cu(I)/Ag(I) efflux system membrane fusion protein
MKSPKAPLAGILVALLVGASTGYFAGKNAPRSTVDSVSDPSAQQTKQRKILYYRNPMGLADISPVPKKDPMGMDYIPVYESRDDTGDTRTPGEVRIGPEKIQKIGVLTEAVQKRALKRQVRAAGRVEADERRLHAVTPRFEGYIERLHVAITGQTVEKGQTLFEVYSPELVSAQREYQVALRGVKALESSDSQNGARLLAGASLERLRNWEISEKEIRAIAQSGAVRRTLNYNSPASGVVIEKNALPGMRFMPGETLYRIADLSTVWVIADIAEQDLGWVGVGAAAILRADAYPDRLFEGKIAYIYPTLDAATRTARARIELANPGLLLKPAMFAQVELCGGSDEKTLALPVSALIDSGTRRIVFIERGEGRFSPREVRTGKRSADFVEVLDGVSEGERVVVAANFLIDAESNLNAAIAGLEISADDGKKAIVHTATGTVDSIDPEKNVISIEHGPIATLNWPSMTMDFTLANGALTKGIEAGARVEFEFVERGAGEWMITKLTRVSGSSVPSVPSIPSNASRPSHTRH